MLKENKKIDKTIKEEKLHPYQMKVADWCIIKRIKITTGDDS